jgi:hypothetical protein
VNLDEEIARPFEKKITHKSGNNSTVLERLR